MTTEKRGEGPTKDSAQGGGACLFCAKHNRSNYRSGCFISGLQGALICSECVGVCLQIVGEHYEKTIQESAKLAVVEAELERVRADMRSVASACAACLGCTKRQHMPENRNSSPSPGNQPEAPGTGSAALPGDGAGASAASSEAERSTECWSTDRRIRKPSSHWVTPRACTSSWHEPSLPLACGFCKVPWFEGHECPSKPEQPAGEGAERVSHAWLREFAYDLTTPARKKVWRYIDQQEQAQREVAELKEKLSNYRMWEQHYGDILGMHIKIAEVERERDSLRQSLTKAEEENGKLRGERDDWREWGMKLCKPPITCDSDMREQLGNAVDSRDYYLERLGVAQQKRFRANEGRDALQKLINETIEFCKEHGGSPARVVGQRLVAAVTAMCQPSSPVDAGGKDRPVMLGELVEALDTVARTMPTAVGVCVNVARMLKDPGWRPGQPGRIESGATK